MSEPKEVTVTINVKDAQYKLYLFINEGLHESERLKILSNAIGEYKLPFEKLERHKFKIVAQGRVNSKLFVVFKV
ncbi:hypothetical protein [Photobacterium minamisatsumaniensis]|uniref:hypothetical protein n=1 Tax=Photobacterium minamisatsumaniensis TaxID=2910233 RepID=UPI003D09CEC5